MPLRRAFPRAAFVLVTLAAPNAYADDAPTATSGRGPTVRVHVDSATKATLEGVDASPICEAPCEIEVPAWARATAARMAPDWGR